MKRLLSLFFLPLFLFAVDSFFYDQWTALTAAGTTSAVNISYYGFATHSVQINTTGSPGTCTIQFEGSLDGANWVNLSGSQNCAATSILMFHLVSRPVRFVRANLTALVGAGASVKVFYYAGRT